MIFFGCIIAYCLSEKKITMPAGSPDLKGKDIIIVADTMIMYADVTRQEEQEDGGFKVAISAKKFTPEVLQYLFEHIVEK